MPDLTDQNTFADGVPLSAFAAMRELPGLHWQPTTIATAYGGFWAVTRYADILAVEKDPQTFTSSRGGSYPSISPNAPVEGPTRDSIMMNDPPVHTRLRRAASSGFVPKVVANFDPWVREIVREQIRRVADRDSFDFVVELAQTIPAYVIARVMGIPGEDRERMLGWVRAMFDSIQASGQTDQLAEGESATDLMTPVFMEIGEYAVELQQEKRAHPGDDMFTALGACVEQGDISQSEFLQWVSLMIVAGYETTATALGQAMRMYLEDDEVRDATDRAVGDGLSLRVADEYVRLVSPVLQMARMATRDLEFAGEQIRERDVMVVYYPAANRDPATFTEPDRFDPWRSEKSHLGYGAGPHRCLGFALANLEIQVFWEELRAADVRLRLDGAPRRGWSNFINQLTALPVARS
ncbi:MAG: cytochrome P450 [Acidimicrobiia bacterium]